MEDKINFLEPLIERAKEYGKASCELYKLKILDKIASTVSSFISRGIVVIILFLFLATLNIGVALWLGELLGRLYYGFFCVAGFYAIMGGVLYFWMHVWIKKRISNSIVLQMLN
jgi:hypothetical protein